MRDELQESFSASSSPSLTDSIKNSEFELGGVPFLQTEKSDSEKVLRSDDDSVIVSYLDSQYSLLAKFSQP